MDEQKHRPHIVLVPYPAQGHFSPLVHLSHQLAARGISVTLVNIQSIHKNITKEWSCPEGFDIRLEQVEFGVEAPAGMSGTHMMKQLPLWIEAVKQMKKAVKKVVQNLRPAPRFIVTDYGLNWGAEVANELNLIPVLYWPGSVAWSCVHNHLDLLLQNEDICQGEQMQYDEKVIDYIPGIQGLQVRDLPAYLRQKDIRDHMSAFVYRLKSCKWILVNSFLELETRLFEVTQTALDGTQFLGVAPLFPLLSDEEGTSTLGGSLREENNNCLEWLNARAPKSVLYISFGSITLLSVATFKELAAGLEASQQAFLWVVRWDMIEDADSVFFQDFVDRTQEQGLMVSWAPQLKVLNHKAVGGFLSHCGWNSILESLCSGVPILGWPFHSEQSMNCQMLEDWKFGRRFSRKELVMRAETEAIVADFMAPNQIMTEVRSNVEAFRQVAQRSAKEGGSSYNNLEKFIQAILVPEHFWSVHE